MKIDLGRTVNTLANIGALVGIVFLAFELHQNTAATQLAAIDNFLSATGQLNIFIAGNADFAELMIKVRDESAKLTPAERLRWEVFAQQTLRTWQNMYFQYLGGALNERIWQSQRKNMVIVLRSDSALRAAWEEDRPRYTSEFNKLVGQMLSEARSN